MTWITFAIKFCGSNTLDVISNTDTCSWVILLRDITGDNDDNIKCIRGYGTKFV